MIRTTKYWTLAAVCVAFLFGSCKNDTKTAASTEKANTNVVESVANAEKVTADSIAAAEAAAKEAAMMAAKEDSIAKATAAAEAAAKAKASKASKATDKSVVKVTPKAPVKPTTKTTTALPNAAPAPVKIVPLPNKGGGNAVKRKGRDDFFTISEVKPDFPGGEGAMMKFLNKNIKYPTMAKEQGIKGTVFVRFVVEKDGLVDDVEIAKGVNPLLDAEAKRVVSSMPKWAAGKQNGTPVAVQYTLPVKFELIE